jgi:hypothetical protein
MQQLVGTRKPFTPVAGGNHELATNGTDDAIRSRDSHEDRCPFSKPQAFVVVSEDRFAASLVTRRTGPRKSFVLS